MHRPRGYSLYDFLVTLVIGSVLAVGAAGMLRVLRSTTQTAEMNAFVSQLNLARTLAVARRRDVVFCPSKDGRRCSASDRFTWWDEGVLLFVDDNGNREVDTGDTIVQRYMPLDSQLRIRTSRHRSRVVYLESGFAFGSNLTFTFCRRHDPAGLKPRYVVISNSGRARVSDTAAQDSCV